MNGHKRRTAAPNIPNSRRFALSAVVWAVVFIALIAIILIWERVLASNRKSPFESDLPIEPHNHQPNDGTSCRLGQGVSRFTHFNLTESLLLRERELSEFESKLTAAQLELSRMPSTLDDTMRVVPITPLIQRLKSGQTFRVISAGLSRSGSTWQFNALKYILRVAFGNYSALQQPIRSIPSFSDLIPKTKEQFMHFESDGYGPALHRSAHHPVSSPKLFDCMLNARICVVKVHAFVPDLAKHAGKLPPVRLSVG